MGLDKVLVIGHSPGKTPINKRKNGSPTLNRLNRWLDACEVDIYSFSNIYAHHKELLKNTDEYKKGGIQADCCFAHEYILDCKNNSFDFAITFSATIDESKCEPPIKMEPSLESHSPDTSVAPTFTLPVARKAILPPEDPLV